MKVKELKEENEIIIKVIEHYIGTELLAEGCVGAGYELEICHRILDRFREEDEEI